MKMNSDIATKITRLTNLDEADRLDRLDEALSLLPPGRIDTVLGLCKAIKDDEDLDGGLGPIVRDIQRVAARWTMPPVYRAPEVNSGNLVGLLVVLVIGGMNVST